MGKMEVTDSVATGQQTPDKPLWGARVVVAGRLASMSRSEAARLIAELGGRLARRISRRTALLVIGRRGLPLSNQGKLSPNLLQVGRLAAQGFSVRTISEEQFLDEIGLARQGEQVHRLYTSEELIGLLGISRSLLGSWLRTELVEPVEHFHSLQYFDFVQVSIAKKLTQLARTGVGTQRIRRSLQRLSQWLPDMEAPLLQLQILERHGPLLFRTSAGHLADLAGQLHIEFSTSDVSSLTLADMPQAAADLFERGCDFEDAGELAAAADAFRQALLVGGPDAETVFNLANVLFAQGHRREACERFRQAVEIDSTFVEAWNNLGVVLAELKQCDEALWAYRKALELDENYADAHYNLAECLHRNGCLSDAQHHWQTYLLHDARSEWASYAQQCLAQRK